MKRKRRGGAKSTSRYVRASDEDFYDSIRNTDWHKEDLEDCAACLVLAARPGMTPEKIEESYGEPFIFFDLDKFKKHATKEDRAALKGVRPVLSDILVAYFHFGYRMALRDNADGALYDLAKQAKEAADAIEDYVNKMSEDGN